MPGRVPRATASDGHPRVPNRGAHRPRVPGASTPPQVPRTTTRKYPYIAFPTALPPNLPYIHHTRQTSRHEVSSYTFHPRLAHTVFPDFIPQRSIRYHTYSIPSILPPYACLSENLLLRLRPINYSTPRHLVRLLIDRPLQHIQCCIDARPATTNHNSLPPPCQPVSGQQAWTPAFNCLGGASVGCSPSTPPPLPPPPPFDIPRQIHEQNAAAARQAPSFPSLVPRLASPTHVPQSRISCTAVEPCHIPHFPTADNSRRPPLSQKTKPRETTARRGTIQPQHCVA